MENTFLSPKKIFLPIQPLIFSFDFSSIFIFRCAHNEPKFRIQITWKTFLSNFSFYAVCIVVCIHILRIYNDRIFSFGWRNGTHFNKAPFNTAEFLVIHLFINLRNYWIFFQHTICDFQMMNFKTNRTQIVVYLDNDSHPLISSLFIQIRSLIEVMTSTEYGARSLNYSSFDIHWMGSFD